MLHTEVSIDKFLLNRQMSREKPTAIYKIILWYYRLIGLPFGGITIKGFSIGTNKFLKFYGYVMAMVITVSNILGIYFFTKNPDLNLIFENSRAVMYLTTIINGMFNLDIIINAWFLQLCGKRMIEIICKFEIRG
jgi:hypothetical protein